MDSLEIEPSASQLTLRSVDKWIKQTNDPILRRVEEWCALSAVWTELEVAGNRDASGSRNDNACASASRNRHDLVGGDHQNPQRPNRFHRAFTLDNITTYHHHHGDDKYDEPDLTQLMNVITDVPNIKQRTTKKQNLLQTQVPTFRGQKNATMSSNTSS